MKNIYYSPEKFGLELVDSHQLSDEPYSFDMLAIWRDTRDHTIMYYEQDSGCSCPTPFEGLQVADLSRFSLEEVEEIVHGGDTDGSEFLRRVRAADAERRGGH